MNYPKREQFLSLNTRQYAAILHDMMTTEGFSEASQITDLATACVTWTRTHMGKNPLAALTDRWYMTDDYSVYDDIEYIADTFSCWIIYSRQYLRMLVNFPTLVSTLDVIETVADVGCGIGMSTVALSQVFPDATIYGTNLPDTIQTTLAKNLASRYSFEIHPTLDKKPDLVFASEYFEHFKNPLTELATVLHDQPRYLVVASTFTQPSIGHFDDYEHEDQPIPGRQMGRAFNTAMTTYGYRRLRTPFWNNRPAIWQFG